MILKPDMNNEQPDAFPVSDSVKGVRNSDDIKILVCYAICGAGAPTPRRVCLNALYRDGVANYFEINSALDELAAAGALNIGTVDGEDMFTAAEGAANIAAGLTDELSDYVKEKALKALKKGLDTDRRLKENTVSVKSDGSGGALLDITMYSDAAKTKELLSLRLSVANTQQAEELERAFLNDPTKLYAGIINALT